MTALRNGGLFAALVALAPAAVLLASALSQAASAEQTTIDGGTWNFGSASTANVVEIELTGVPTEGLGDADISVAFESAILDITACSAGDLDGACNPNAPTGPARAAGFRAPAVTAEPVVIARLTFDCVGAGSSALTITVNELMDGTPGASQPITATVQNGTVVCGAGCFGDFNVDGAITITDILLIKPAFGTQSGDVNYDATFDLNSDGRISIIDILLLKPVFGTSCP